VRRVWSSSADKASDLTESHKPHEVLADFPVVTGTLSIWSLTCMSLPFLVFGQEESLQLPPQALSLQ
jgi:hypothetical protein